MKVTQQKFSPATIVLETKDELFLLKWALAEAYETNRSGHETTLAQKAYSMYLDIEQSTV
jgi:hypothetical protein